MTHKGSPASKASPFSVGHIAALPAIPDVPPEQREEKMILRTQIPSHKARGGAFYASAICHYKIHNSSRVSRHGHFCRGHPEQLRRSDSQTMCSKVKTGEKILLNKHRGVNGSESKIHLNPLIGNNSKCFRHYVVTIRCKHGISDLQKTESFCSIFVRAEVPPVLKFLSTTLCEFQRLQFNNVTRVRF